MKRNINSAESMDLDLNMGDTSMSMPDPDLGVDPIVDLDISGGPPEPKKSDNEGALAKADLYKMAHYSVRLFRQLEDDTQLESWVQAKITKAADYLASVFHYLEYEMKFSEYGEKLDNAEMYSESDKQRMRLKLAEARNKIRHLKRIDAEKLFEGRKRTENNFDVTDIDTMKTMTDMDALKKYALKLIHKPSSRPINPAKQRHFEQGIEQAKRPEQILKIFYDMLLSSEGLSTIGSSNSMDPNGYRKKFGEDLNEISDDAKKNYRSAAGHSIKDAQKTGDKKKMSKRLRGISKTLDPSKKLNQPVEEMATCSKSTAKKTKTMNRQKKEKLLKESKHDVVIDAERRERMNKLMPAVAKKMKRNFSIPMTYREAEEFAEFVEQMSTELVGPTIFADDIVDYLESHDMLDTGDVDMTVKESFGFESDPEESENLDIKILKKHVDDGTCTVEVTSSDGRTLTIERCETPEMSQDEFEWAWAECKAGRGDEYGFKITTALHEFGDEENDVISAPDSSSWSDEENDVISAPPTAFGSDEGNDVMSAPSDRDNPDLARIKSLSGIK